MPRRVLIVQKTLPQYRRRFFELLREYLAREDIELVLIYGQPEPAEASKRDVVHLDWAVERRTLFLPVAGQRRLYWQPCLGDAMQADLVIVEQASKLMVNYVLLALQMAGMKRLAFWGHGMTPKATPPSHIGEAAKAFMSRRVHWWFAYNELSARYVRELGFDAARITAVENAIDTRVLAAAGTAVTEEELGALRAKLGLTGTNVCLYVGALYREKRLPFLIAACELVRRQMPDFEMLFLGSGPDRHVVEEAVARNPWMRYLGPRFDDDRVPYFRLAKLALMPGGVGLGILDSFALELPMVTTAVAYHGPEIDYLEDGVNGVFVQDGGSPTAYAARIVALLSDPPTLERLKAGCQKSACVYSVENMARNLADGVVSALDAEPLRRRGTASGGPDSSSIPTPSRARVDESTTRASQPMAEADAGHQAEHAAGQSALAQARSSRPSQGNPANLKGGGEIHNTTDQGVRTVHCYNCGEGRADYYARENGYTLVRCVNCGLLYVNPRPELEDMASATQVGVHVGEEDLNTTGHFNRFRVRAYRGVLRDLYGSDLIQRQRRWLDLGCGHGEFLMALERYGRGYVSALGYEPNARKMRGAWLRGLSVSDVYPSDGEASLDVVSALNVYSHLDDPSKEIARWARVLAPGGELVLQTGDTAHMPASSHPRPFRLPDHLSFASEPIVTRILHGSGFAVVAVKKYRLFPLRADLLAIETAKAFMPGRTSRLWQMLDPRYRSDDYLTDMWIRARLR